MRPGRSPRDCRWSPGWCFLHFSEISLPRTRSGPARLESKMAEGILGDFARIGRQEAGPAQPTFHLKQRSSVLIGARRALREFATQRSSRVT